MLFIAVHQFLRTVWDIVFELFITTELEVIKVINLLIGPYDRHACVLDMCELVL